MCPDVRGAGAGRRHDRLVAVEHLDESSGQGPCLVHVAGVEVHLAAACLLTREFEVDSRTLEDPHRRPPDLRRERVGETRDEECVRHCRCGAAGREGREQEGLDPRPRACTSVESFQAYVRGTWHVNVEPA